ncbi:pyridoxamine 5'-phosphate oxidase family protein [Prauserella muralis]|uniref:Pyridoxamine 5'-phosphate oxidase n=1 Tax=Prauserella muralis TaxID=588067 RepID=A0A2V4B6T3_9PSEU|nr:pyridoxamine 5'-phosphate oxidase family protein [Prauserella muralis]PXY31048.1 pyridoxamine 5'-phosphate oxidase [Prauserella muralis]TWE14674.1 pyridoxamine 5'-phosphate oxidase [Prauserella muralis]
MTPQERGPADALRLPQGDVGLLETEVAQRLLASRELARIAYVAHDGTPRVLPMLFHWTGEELVLPTFAPSAKVTALRAKPDLAVTIDTTAAPPEVLLLRGRAELTEVDGVLEEYVLAQRRYYGAEQAEAATADARRMGARMVRIALRPAWVGVIDFQTRLPAPLSKALA